MMESYYITFYCCEFGNRGAKATLYVDMLVFRIKHFDKMIESVPHGVVIFLSGILH